jgi:hypothetical protein
MKLNKKIIIGGLIFLVISFVFLFIFNKENTELVVKNEETKIREKAIIELDPQKMSRISFFNSSKDRVSLAIPEWWEGKYRINEIGDSVVFVYIDSFGKSQILFVIKKYLDDIWEEDNDAGRNINEVKFLKKQNIVSSYFLSTDDDSNSYFEKDYRQMKNEIKLVIKTIK